MPSGRSQKGNPARTSGETHPRPGCWWPAHPETGSAWPRPTAALHCERACEDRDDMFFDIEGTVVYAATNGSDYPNWEIVVSYDTGSGSGFERRALPEQIWPTSEEVEKARRTRGEQWDSLRALLDLTARV